MECAGATPPNCEADLGHPPPGRARAEGEGEVIRQRYREAFEQLGAVDLTQRLNAGLYDEDKRKAARIWLDEHEHGEDLGYKAEQLKLQRRADLKSTIALVVAGLALIVSDFAALGRHYTP
jgi:hypothetical protein